VTTDLGKGQARADDAVPRQRGGAHAAARNGRFRRKSGSAAEPASRRAETPGATPPGSRAPGRALQAPAPGPREPGRPGESSSQVPWPRQTSAARAGDTQPSVPAVHTPSAPSEHSTRSAPSTPAGPQAHASIIPARSRASRARSAAAGLCAVALVAAVIPLVALQVPDAIAWSVPAPLASAGTATLVSVLRASGLALPAMAVAASIAALAVRWLRAGPVLLAGLMIIAAADVLGDAGPSILLIGTDRSLHGVGAGIAMTAVAAVVADRPRLARRSLAGWWAAFTVAGLAATPALMRRRLAGGDWHAALHPYPWLTGGALILAAVYALVAEGAPTTASRTAFPATERAQLALLTAPVGGICAIAVAATYRGDKAVVAAAIAAAVALIGITAVTARAGTAARFAAICAVTGFTLAPAAGVVTVLSPPGADSGVAVLAGALCGAALAMATRRVRAVTATGLSLAAAGFAALYPAGPGSPLTLPGMLAGGWADPHSHVLAVICVPLAAGLAAALTAALRGTKGAASGTAGAMAGAVLLLTGLVAGYLAAGAMQVRALTGVRSAPGVQHALISAAGRWVLVAAGAAIVFALVMAFVTRWRAIVGPGRKADGALGAETGEIVAGTPGRRAATHRDHG
jgi:hypothetical protein